MIFAIIRRRRGRPTAPFSRGHGLQMLSVQPGRNVGFCTTLGSCPHVGFRTEDPLLSSISDDCVCQKLVLTHLTRHESPNVCSTDKHGPPSLQEIAMREMMWAHQTQQRIRTQTHAKESTNQHQLTHVTKSLMIFPSSKLQVFLN